MTIDEKIRMAKDLLINNLSSDANVSEVEQFVDLVIEIAAQQMFNTEIDARILPTTDMKQDEGFLKALGL